MQLASELDVPALVIGARDDPFFTGLDADVSPEGVRLGAAPSRSAAADDDFRLAIPRVWAQLACDARRSGSGSGSGSGSSEAASSARGTVLCCETDFGGHCSFYESTGSGRWLMPSAGSWADRAACDFLCALLPFA